jgi:hypothetical protein
MLYNKELCEILVKIFYSIFSLENLLLLLLFYFTLVFG